MLATTIDITVDFLELQESSKSININKTNFNFSIIKFAKDIEYFNSIYNNSNNTLVVNINCYIFY